MVAVNYKRVEAEARKLQMEIWDHQASLWPGETVPASRMFTPEAAAAVLRVELGVGDLGQFGSRDGRFEVAGVIDRQRNFIGLSDKFSSPTMRFTGAHEIGHWVLHRGMVMHRDRPIAGVVDPRVQRSSDEREADYFAACFLVPRKLLVEAFGARFGYSQLQLNEDSAFRLAGNTSEQLLNAGPGSLDFALAVASALSYNGRHFDSLAKAFDVSVPTMAIRLREVGLVSTRWP